MRPTKPHLGEKVAAFIFISAIGIYAGNWIALGFPIERDQDLGATHKSIETSRPATSKGTPSLAGAQTIRL